MGKCYLVPNKRIEYKMVNMTPGCPLVVEITKRGAMGADIRSNIRQEYIIGNYKY